MPRRLVSAAAPPIASFSSADLALKATVEGGLMFTFFLTIFAIYWDSKEDRKFQSSQPAKKTNNILEQVTVESLGEDDKNDSGTQEKSESREDTKEEDIISANLSWTAKKLQSDYLSAYVLAMFADWLQGPYVYALYHAYGFSKADNGVLFIFGFGSSMIFGTIIGGYADKFGRKRFAILFCAVYMASCLTKHFNNFYILILGRLLAGVATSLLFSVFESWLVSEHGKRSLPDSVLANIFSWAMFGNSLVAIIAGFAAQWVSDLKDFEEIGVLSFP